MTKARNLTETDAETGKYGSKGSVTSGQLSEGRGYLSTSKVHSVQTVKKYYRTRKPLVIGHALVELGYPAKALSQLIDGRLTRDDVRTVIADRTLDRRIADERKLSVDEVDAIIRLLRVTEAARKLFENDARADHWLRHPNPALDGAIPIRLARTDVGGRAVEQVLGRLEYGIYS